MNPSCNFIYIYISLRPVYVVYPQKTQNQLIELFRSIFQSQIYTINI